MYCLACYDRRIRGREKVSGLFFLYPLDISIIIWYNVVVVKEETKWKTKPQPKPEQRWKTSLAL